MTIREARPGDAAAIARIANVAIRDSLATFTTRERAADEVADEIAARGPLFLVAEQGARVVGFATCGAFRNGPGYAHTMEHTVYLAEDAQRRGLGAALMQQLEQTASAQGAHVLVGCISGANPGAIAFHNRIGFREVGRMPEVGRKQGQWLDLMLMQKILGSR